jgi:hypothetical protein
MHYLQRFTNLLILKEVLPQRWKESRIAFIYKKGDKTNCSNYEGYQCFKLYTKFYPLSLSQN